MADGEPHFGNQLDMGLRRGYIGENKWESLLGFMDWGHRAESLLPQKAASLAAWILDWASKAPAYHSGISNAKT